MKKYEVTFNVVKLVEAISRRDALLKAQIENNSLYGASRSFEAKEICHCGQLVDPFPHCPDCGFHHIPQQAC